MSRGRCEQCNDTVDTEDDDDGYDVFTDTYTCWECRRENTKQQASEDRYNDPRRR